MDRFPANEHNIKRLGIDFDNLTHSEIIDAIYKIDGAVYDSETNLIYTDIMDCFDDEKYFNLLREVGVPTLSDFLKQLSSIKDEKIRTDLHYHGFFKILDAEYNAKFKILDLMLKNKELDESGKENIISSSKGVVHSNFEHLKASYKNLVNDPLFHPDNEHILLEKELNNKINERLEQNRLNDIYYFDDFDDDFKKWQKEQNFAIEKSFRQLVRKLNQEKIFFFGCSFDNYKHNYEKRLNVFLENYYDAEESDFIKSEEEFLENILHDLKNPEGAHDGYAVSGYDNFSKAYKIVSALGFDQYIFSDNKKTTFLNERLAKLSKSDLSLDEQPNKKTFSELIKPAVQDTIQSEKRNTETIATIPTNENTPLYQDIIKIINHPSVVLMDITDDYLGLDSEGNELFPDNIEDFEYDYETHIIQKFKNINYLTTQLLENKTQSVIDGFLNIVFRELMEIMPIIVDYCQNTVFKQQNYPKNRYLFFYFYYRALCDYYDFLIEFVNKETFLKFNKIRINDDSYFAIEEENTSSEKEIENTDPNNFLRSTIHEYLEELKIEINGNGYDILVNALFEYFSNGSFPTLTTKINFKKINKKRVGWALKELYKSEKTANLEIEYFRFAKDNINLFANEIIVEKDFKKSKFYKAFTTNPAK